MARKATNGRNAADGRARPRRRRAALALQLLHREHAGGGGRRGREEAPGGGGPAGDAAVRLWRLTSSTGSAARRVVGCGRARSGRREGSIAGARRLTPPACVMLSLALASPMPSTM